MRTLFNWLFGVKIDGHNHRGRKVHMECQGCGNALREFVGKVLPQPQVQQEAPQ